MRFNLFCGVLCCAYICQGAANYTEERRHIYPNLDGNACSKSDSGATKSGLVKVTTERAVKMTLRMPTTWEPGIYVCTWDIVAVSNDSDAANGSQEEMGLKVQFSALMHGLSNMQRRSIGHVTVGVPSLGFTFQEFKFSKYPSGNKVYNTPNYIQMKLRLNITENDRFQDSDTFYVDISVDKVPIWPKRFKVNEISKQKEPGRPVRNYRFTWIEARKFCKRGLPGWDLCPTNELFACFRRSPFSHSSIDQPIQYFPVLSYNQWARVVANNSECSDWPGATNGPPRWGIDKKYCPEEGCESKTYIYCCSKGVQTARSLKQFGIRSKPLKIHVTSGRSNLGQYHYRFAWGPDVTYEDEDYHIQESSWADYWKPAGRIPGDIRVFQMHSTFSTRSRTVVYFCNKVLNGVDEIENYRYMVSLTPCKQPWSYMSHAYAHMKPRGGLRPIYFGQSSSGEGTRVSLTPPCCEFNETEKSFILYAKVREKWEMELSSRFCHEAKEFTAPNGAISSESLLIPAYSSPLFCSWRIKVRKGYGISITYTYNTLQNLFSLQTRNYLGFSNRNSKRIYGRSYEDETKSFLTDSNLLDIELVLEETTLVNFSITYEEVSKPSPLPVKFKLDSVTGTWERAHTLCSENGLQLCSKLDLCPIGNYPAGDIQSGSPWIAVADLTNEWIWSGADFQENKTCMFHSTLSGPPDWGMRDLNMANAKLVTRETVYCCNRLPVTVPVPESVPVIVGMNERFGEDYFWFNHSEEWKSPSYMFSYDDPYHEDFGDWEIVYPWRPPSTFTGAAANTADFFSMSSHYEKRYFEQVVYFCKWSRHLGLSQLTPFDDHYKISLRNCEWPEWEYDFHLYAGMQKSEKTTIELHVGQVELNTGYSCCKNNPHKFSVYVIDAGKVDSYIHPTSNSSTEYYYYQGYL